MHDQQLPPPAVPQGENTYGLSERLCTFAKSRIATHQAFSSLHLTLFHTRTADSQNLRIHLWVHIYSTRRYTGRSIYIRFCTGTDEMFNTTIDTKRNNQVILKCKRCLMQQTTKVHNHTFLSLVKNTRGVRPISVYIQGHI